MEELCELANQPRLSARKVAPIRHESAPEPVIVSVTAGHREGRTYRLSKLLRRI
ncbi:hypothetical protein ASPBRDRAFT_42196 [Aspergillus brasiliensis CBS 101740]|uniref:Uncharacterized protein n=1 Tax=Aspergillus brasiliensis (strain CBS 101740 / IMI 381727 / IBT 21946) TaxID=767769 RepID=A0A1L9ULL7_ASPBC|nr:hypothetical protein ASPBRDRAFT_42196 [Aspergillus brasiliensis CBS 101740]